MCGAGCPGADARTASFMGGSRRGHAEVSSGGLLRRGGEVAPKR